MNRSPLRSNRLRGFTLLEMLSVLTITAVLAGLALPAVSDASRGNVVTGSLAVLSGLLDQARQAAVAKNTFVWVAFSDAPANAPEDGVVVAVIGATGGVDSFGWNESPTSLAHNPDLELLVPPRTLKSVKLSDVGVISVAGLPAESAGNLAALQGVDFQARVGGQTRRFTRAMQFTPTGEARVKAFRRYIEFGLTPAVGDSGNSAVLRLAGLTGRTYVYRPF